MHTVLLKVPELAECGRGWFSKKGSCYQRKETEAGEAGRAAAASETFASLLELPSEGGPGVRQCFHFLPFDPLSFIPFLQGLDWAALAARKIPAPFDPDPLRAGCGQH